MVMGSRDLVHPPGRHGREGRHRSKEKREEKRDRGRQRGTGEGYIHETPH